MKVVLRFETIAIASKATTHILTNEPVKCVGIIAEKKGDDGFYYGSCLGWASCNDSGAARIRLIMIGMGGKEMNDEP